MRRCPLDHRFQPEMWQNGVSGWLASIDGEREDAEVYSAKAGVYPVVNIVMRNHNETKAGFRSFVRLLHDTPCNPIPPMFRWVGPATAG